MFYAEEHPTWNGCYASWRNNIVRDETIMMQAWVILFEKAAPPDVSSEVFIYMFLTPTDFPGVS
jgi:hypothetical protein